MTENIEVAHRHNQHQEHYGDHHHLRDQYNQYEPYDPYGQAGRYDGRRVDPGFYRGGYGGSRTLTFGSAGPEVEALQRRLNRVGFCVPITGNYLEMTQEAVRRYQSTHGLYADGIAGPNTLRQLGL
jgi:hypothetical protein